MPRRRHTRRQALQLGAAAAATGLVAPRAGAASCGGTFEVAVDDVPRATASAAGWRTTPALRAPRRFDLIGLRWARGSDAEAQVRARRRGGTWTPWVPLHPAGDHGPDAGRSPAGTDPVFVGSADVFQLRLRGHPRRLRARFVRALPDARAARSRARFSRARQAQGGAPAIVPRDEWGADRCPPREDPSYGRVDLAFVHHTVTANDYAPEDSAAIVLGICRYHRDSNKWNDVGYNFLVDKYGQIFEGRAGGVDQAVIGAQAQGWNSVSTGLSVLGDYTGTPLTAEGVEAVAQLLAWKLPLHGVPVEGSVTVTSGGGASNRYSHGDAVTFQRISGHRDGNETACPGSRLYAQLPAIRDRAAALAGPVSRLTLRIASAEVEYTEPAEVSGSLRFADGASASGARVVVEHSMGGGTYQQVVTATADASGHWSASVELPGSGRLRARFAGSGSQAPLTSSSVKVTVLGHIFLELDANRVAPGQKIKVRGAYAPEPGPGEAVLVIERNVRGTWKRVSRREIRLRDGYRVVAGVRRKRPGLYRVVVWTPTAVSRRRFRVVR